MFCAPLNDVREWGKTEKLALLCASKFQINILHAVSATHIHAVGLHTQALLMRMENLTVSVLSSTFVSLHNSVTLSKKKKKRVLTVFTVPPLPFFFPLPVYNCAFQVPLCKSLPLINAKMSYVAHTVCSTAVHWGAPFAYSKCEAVKHIVINMWLCHVETKQKWWMTWFHGRTYSCQSWTLKADSDAEGWPLRQTLS